MNQDRFGMLDGPTIGKHLFQPRVVGVESQQEVPDVGPRFQAMAFGAGQDRVQDGRPWPRLRASYE